MLLDKQIAIIARDEIAQIPSPQRAIIKKINPDGSTDILVKNQLIQYVETIGTPVVDNTGVLLFIDNNPSDYILIC